MTGEEGDGAAVLFHSFQASCFIGLENCCEGGGEGENTDIPVNTHLLGERKKIIFLKQLSCWRCSPQSRPILCAKGSENTEMLALPNAFQGREDNRG